VEALPVLGQRCRLIEVIRITRISRITGIITITRIALTLVLDSGSPCPLNAHEVLDESTEAQRAR
jgi:hypothetical protein